MAEKHEFDVFVSHAAKDKPWASELASALREAGVNIWFDEFDLMPGEPWQEKIAEALRASRTIVMVLSAQTAESPWTFFELGAAVADHKRIIPVAREEIDLAHLPSPLRRLQILRESSPQEAGRRVAEVLERESGQAA
jgi:TIR domain-containing protein